MNDRLEFGDPRAIRMAQGKPRFEVKHSELGMWVVTDYEHNGMAAFATIVEQDAIDTAEFLNNMPSDYEAHYAHSMELLYDEGKRGY